MATAQKLMELDYNEQRLRGQPSKAVLDGCRFKVAAGIPNLTAVLSGFATPGEPRNLDWQRAQNAMAYLTQVQGNRSAAHSVKAGTDSGRKVEVWTLPAGAALPGAPQRNRHRCCSAGPASADAAG